MPATLNPNGISNAATDNGPAWTYYTLYTAHTDLTSAANITSSPGETMCIVLDDILISTDTLMEIQVRMAGPVDNTLLGVFLPANGTVQLTFRNPIKGDTANKQLQAVSSAAGNVHITTTWHLEA
jgi:hypothetical protein